MTRMNVRRFIESGGDPQTIKNHNYFKVLAESWSEENVEDILSKNDQENELNNIQHNIHVNENRTIVAQHIDDDGDVRMTSTQKSPTTQPMELDDPETMENPMEIEDMMEHSGNREVDLMEIDSGTNVDIVSDSELESIQGADNLVPENHATYQKISNTNTELDELSPARMKEKLAAYGYSTPQVPKVTTTEQTFMDTRATQFSSACRKIAAEMHIIKPKRAPRKFISAPLRRLLQRRQQLEHQLLVLRKLESEKHSSSNQTSDQLEEIEETMIDLKKKIRRRIKHDHRAREHKKWAQANLDQTYDPKSFFQHIGRKSKYKGKDSIGGSQPIYDTLCKKVVTDADRVNQVWFLHFRKLATDPNLVKEELEWQRVLVPGLGPVLKPKLSTDHLNRMITLEEMCEALKAMKYNKAPGKDAVTADFLKLVVSDMHDNNPDPSPMTRLMLFFCNSIFGTGAIPTEWQQSIVLPIPKKGDLTKTDNYRGISLMNCMLKVLLTITCKRLNTWMEDNEFYTPAQAGFRTKEECVTQAAALFEMCRRRQILNQKSFITFIDLQKAYDTVPIGALMTKLQRYGINGRILHFLRSLYSQSKVTVRTGAVPFQYSEPFNLERGVRQGCPCSTVLFNIFINDLPEELERSLGTQVPTGTVFYFQPRIKIASFLFADDLATVAGSAEQAAQQCQVVEQWINKNGMTAGIKKCGVMRVRTEDERKRGVKIEIDDATRDMWRIHGKRLPVVTEYEYLGIVMNQDLNRDRMAQARKKSASKTMRTIQPFMQQKNVPLQHKIRVLKTVCIPKMLYGAELFGMCASFTQSTQVKINRILRMALGTAAASSVANAPLWEELDVPPIRAIAAGRKIRGFIKATQLKSHIRSIMQQPFKYKCYWTWVLSTKGWFKRWGRRYLEDYREELWNAGSFSGRKQSAAEPEVLQTLLTGDGTIHLNDPEDPILNASPPDVGRVLQQAVWFREREKFGKNSSSSRYRFYNFKHQRLLKQSNRYILNFDAGIRAMTQMRLNIYPTSVRKARILRDSMSEEDRELLKTQCPFCKNHQPEDLYHIWVECSRWSFLRRRFRILPIIQAAENCIDRIITTLDAEYPGIRGLTLMDNELQILDSIFDDDLDETEELRTHANALYDGEDDELTSLSNSSETTQFGEGTTINHTQQFEDHPGAAQGDWTNASGSGSTNRNMQRNRGWEEPRRGGDYPVKATCLANAVADFEQRRKIIPALLLGGSIRVNKQMIRIANMLYCPKDRGKSDDIVFIPDREEAATNSVVARPLTVHDSEFTEDDGFEIIPVPETTTTSGERPIFRLALFISHVTWLRAYVTRGDRKGLSVTAQTDLDLMLQRVE